MRSTLKKHPRSTKSKMDRTARKSQKVNAAPTIRRMGEEWAQHWNAGELDEVVAVYSDDAVYLPPHHKAVHGRSRVFENAAPAWRVRSSI